MGWGNAAFFALAAIAASPAALAQAEPSCHAKEAEARNIMFDGERPVAAATTLPGMYVHVAGGDCRILTLYLLSPRVVPADAPASDFRRAASAYRGKLAPTRIVARFIDDQNTRKWSPRWADEQTCPQLRAAIVQLDGILAPSFSADRLYRGVTNGVTDQQVYRFSSLTPHGPPFDLDHELQIDLQSPPDAPFGEWFETTLQTLDACWSFSEPQP